MDILSGEEFANALEKFASSSDFEKKEFIRHFKRNHNTHQQSMFGVILRVVEAVGSPDYRHDGRNKHSHQRAMHAVEGIKSGVVKDLQDEDPYYWREERAKEWVYGENYDLTKLPFI